MRCQGYQQFMTSTKFQLGQVKNKTNVSRPRPSCLFVFSKWGGGGEQGGREPGRIGGGRGTGGGREKGGKGEI